MYTGAIAVWREEIAVRQVKGSVLTVVGWPRNSWA